MPSSSSSDYFIERATISMEAEPGVAALLRVLSMKIADAPSFEAALRAVIQEVCTQAGWCWGEIWVPDATKTHLVYFPIGSSGTWAERGTLRAFRQASLNRTFPRGGGLPGSIWETGKPVWLEDLAGLPPEVFVRSEAALAAGLRAGFGVPILNRTEELLAVLVFFSTRTCPADERVMDTFRAIAVQLAAVARLRKAERDLLQSKQQFQTTMDTLPGVVFSSNPDANWSMRSLSEGCFSVTGYRNEELLGDTYNKIVFSADLPLLLGSIREAVDNHRLYYTVEYRLQAKDETERWVRECGRILYDAIGRPAGLQGFITDVTERKRVEVALSQSERCLAALVKMQQLLLAWDGREPQEIYKRVVRLLGSTIGASRAYVFAATRAPDGALLINRVAEWCAPGVSSELQNPALQNVRCTPTEFPDMAVFLEKGEPYSKLVARAHPCEQARFVPQGIQSLLVVPLRVGNGLVGCVGFDDCAAERVWEPAIVSWLMTAATNISQTLERRQAELQYRSIFENAVEGIYQSTLGGRYLKVNPMLAQMYGYDSPETLASELTDISRQLYVDPRQRQRFIREMADKGLVHGFESQVRRRDGSIIWISECARALYAENGSPIGYEGTVEDITARKLVETELRRQQCLLDGVARVASLLLSQPDLERAIPQMLTILGEAAEVDRAYVYENYAGSQPGDTLMSMRFEWTRPGCAPTIDRPHWQNASYEGSGLGRWLDAFERGRAVAGVVRALPPNEREILSRDGILSIVMVPVLVGNRLWGYVGFDACREARQWLESEQSILFAAAASLGSAIERQRAEDLLRQQAYSDALTCLPNRPALEVELDGAIARARAANAQLAVLFFDLDRFKLVNDSLGHAAGDVLLLQLARRLQGNLPPTATVARWGGDEFVCLLPDVADSEDALAVATHLRESLAVPFEHEGDSFRLTGSFGIALYPTDGRDRETLLRNADAALYDAKNRGRNCTAFFAPKLNSQAAARLQLENQLYRALESNQFAAEYQPIATAATGKPVGMEALLRWDRPQAGRISPASFIPLAEENGTIVPLGEWVLQSACQQYARWQAEGIAPEYVAVNLSPIQLRDPNLLDRFLAIVTGAGIDPRCVQLEITETAAMQNLDRTLAILNACRARGLQVALDDFGTGYASLSHLRRLPLDVLKVDRAFIANLATSSEDAAIVETILSLGRGLKLTTTAEGVETQAQRERLLALGCDCIQGFFYSRPLDTEAARAFLRRSAESAARRGDRAAADPG